MLANTSGRTFESVVIGLIGSKGIDFIPQAALPIRSIFNKQVRVDILIEPCSRVPNGLIVECKWQDVTGSAEEKLPYLVLNIKRQYPYPSIIVIDGDGFTDGAIEWTRTQVDGKRLLAVFSIREFISWCNREL
jgi:hypothetical protein